MNNSAISTDLLVSSVILDTKLEKLLPSHALEKLREEVEIVRGLCKPFDKKAFLEGHMTPVYFGSAINNFGVCELLTGLSELAPAPRPQPSSERLVEPFENKVSGFVPGFKSTL